MKFYSYVVGGDKCLVFLEGIFEEIFGKLLINGKKAVLGTDTGKRHLYLKSTPRLKPMSRHFKPSFLSNVLCVASPFTNVAPLPSLGVIKSSSSYLSLVASTQFNLLFPPIPKAIYGPPLNCNPQLLFKGRYAATLMGTCK